jgi:hypothetical protein
VKKDKDEERPRNWVHKAVQELGIKPSRHRDRKYDYDRAQRRRIERDGRTNEGEEVLERSRPRKQEKRLSANKDRSRDSQGQLDSEWWMQSDEDPSDSEEV